MAWQLPEMAAQESGACAQRNHDASVVAAQESGGRAQRNHDASEVAALASGGRAQRNHDASKVAALASRVNSILITKSINLLYFFTVLGPVKIEGDFPGIMHPLRSLCPFQNKIFCLP